MQCAKCGTSNRLGVKFCEECGARLSLACPGCGSPILRGKKFCGECGIPLTPSPAHTQQSTPLPSSPSILHPHPPQPDQQSPLDYTPGHLADRILSEKTALEGERKIVTVLFTDIRGSMDIMESLDPEEALQLVDPCLQLMMQAVHRFEGTVNRILGDGIMALFGAPLALEDHPQRALYAALSMHDLVSGYAVDIRRSHGIALQIRVGINTGEVVVRTIGNDLCMDYSAVGHAVGLAARLESLAPPGSTLVTLDTYRLTHKTFHFEAKGAVAVKGVSHPVETFEIIEPYPVGSRSASPAGQGWSPLIGRASELAHLQTLVALAASGHGQIVSLSGEAGVGKSRLLEELKATLRSQQFILIEGAAFPYGKTRAYLPWIEMFKNYCHINDQDDPHVYRDKVHQKLLSADPSLTGSESVFLELLGVDSNDPTIANLSAEARLQHVIQGTKRLIAAESQRHPVAFVVEDLHWLDAKSLDFLRALTVGIATLPALFLLSYRPNSQQYAWEAQSFSHRLQLTPLPQALSQSLFTSLVGTDASVASLVPLVSEKSGGNPFFLEEIVQHLVETGILIGQPGQYRMAYPLSEWSPPTTVQGVLASRLDRLEPHLKQLLQTASVIGREFSRLLLSQVLGCSKAELDQACRTLQTHEFVYETTGYPDTVFTFKHALTQEVAYHSLLQAHREDIHAAVGAAIETLYSDKLQEYVTVLAYHYSRSAETDKAEHYLYSAGLRAVELYADTDAQHFWEQHLDLLRRLPHTAKRDQLEVRTRLQLMKLLSRHNSDDRLTHEQFTHAEAACQRLNNTPLLASVHATLAGTYVLWGRPKSGLPHAHTALQLSAELADPKASLRPHGPLAHLLWLAGRFEEGLQVAQAGLDLIRRSNLLDTQPASIISPYAQCLAISGVCQGFLGNFEPGFEALQQANRLAAEYKKRIPQAFSYLGLALLYALRRELTQSQPEAHSGLLVMQESGGSTGVQLARCAEEYFTIMATVSQSSSQSRSQSDAFANRSTASLVQTWQDKGAYYELTSAWLAETLFYTNQQDRALALAKSVLSCAQASDSSWFLYNVQATLGAMYSEGEPSDSDRAETHWSAALEQAKIMHSQPFMTHASLALGRVLANRLTTHMQNEQRATVARACNYLTQAARIGETIGLTKDSTHAQTLLAQLPSV